MSKKCLQSPKHIPVRREDHCIQRMIQFLTTKISGWFSPGSLLISFNPGAFHEDHLGVIVRVRAHLFLQKKIFSILRPVVLS